MLSGASEIGFFGKIRFLKLIENNGLCLKRMGKMPTKVCTNAGFADGILPTLPSDNSTFLGIVKMLFSLIISLRMIACHAARMQRHQSLNDLQVPLEDAGMHVHLIGGAPAKRQSWMLKGRSLREPSWLRLSE